MKEIRNCVICKIEEFKCKTTSRKKTCSLECSRKLRNQNIKKIQQRPEAKERRREYQRKYHQRLEVKEKVRKYREKPEVKERVRKYQ